jgi:dienelactone hydrolase
MIWERSMRLAVRLVALIGVLAIARGAEAQELVKFPPLEKTGSGALQITGHVYRPRAVAKAPAMLILHGCGGVEANAWQWAAWLAANGYVALVVDSFAPRNRQGICAQPIGHHEYRIQDAFGAAAWLQQQPYVDPARIGVMGFSHGGGMAMVLALEEGRQFTAPTAPRFRVSAPFYPGGCGVALSPAGRQLLAAPVRIPTLVLHAAQDDWTPAAPCQAWVEAARRRGDPISIILYPDAHHGFDMVDRPITRRPFPRADEGGARGVTVGGNVAARDAARRDLLAFLKKFL